MSAVTGIGGGIGDDGKPRADKRDGGRRWPRRRSPLLPEAGAAGAPLTAVIAVIASLAALALAAFIIIAAAADNWTTELSSSLTIQVKGASREEISTRTDLALAVIERADGVVDSKVVTSEEAARLLEPWLGKGNAGELNVPALIELKVTEAGRRGLDELEQSLAAAAPGLVLDDHGDWNRRLLAAARSAQALAFGVFVLILGAACAVSILAARAGLAANAQVVSLLHLVGATDDFIANEVQRRFLVIALRGALIGLALAVFALGLFALATRARGAEAFLVPGLTLGPSLVAPLLAVPVAICLATAISARFAVLRSLREAY